MKKFIITVSGKDQPGIIAAVTQVLFDHDFNIEDVRQTIVQREFSGIFIVTGSATARCTPIREAVLAATRPMALDCHVKRLDPAPQPWTTAALESYVISTRGPDGKGLVAQITALLAQHRVNVTQLHAVFRGGSDPNDNVMVYEVDVPGETDVETLRSKIKEKAEQLNLSVYFQHKDIFEAINRI